jgi:hypothetical protein
MNSSPAGRNTRSFSSQFSRMQAMACCLLSQAFHDDFAGISGQMQDALESRRFVMDAR